MTTADAHCPNDPAGRTKGAAHGERLSVLECRFDEFIATLATKADLAGVQADIHRWMLATVVGLFLGFGGLFLAMSNALKPASQWPAAAQAPIVISLPVPTPQTPASPAK